MIQINDLEIIKNKRKILEILAMNLNDASINALVGEEKSGKSLLASTIHGLYSNYQGIIDFHNLNKRKKNSYLIVKDVLLLSDKTASDNFSFPTKEYFEAIREYSFLAGLENDLERKVSELPYSKQKLIELSIGCGINPQLLIIDDFDLCFTNQSLALVGLLLSKFKTDGGIVLLTSSLNIPEMDSSFSINNGKVVKL